MVAIELIGGLGNQMFQYATAKALALKRNEQLFLDKHLFADYQLHDYALHHFNLEAKFIEKEDLIFESNSVLKKIKSFFYPKKLFYLYEEKALPYDEKLQDLSQKNIYLKGYFQSEKYFKKFEEEIRSDFQIKTPLQKKTVEMLKLITKVNSVSLHIRRGDYVSNPEANSVHGTCDLNYYHRSIEIIKKEMNNPVFFIFSDDISWAKENLKINDPTHFIDFTNAATNFEDLKMMSHCKNNIIANSSFSWWGAWLNNNKNKIVIAPDKWFNIANHNAKDIIPESWQKI